MKHSPRSILASLAGPALAAVLLAGCADKPELRLDGVSIQAAGRANDFAPVAVDVVLVQDAKLVDELLKLNASDWFGRKEQILRDHPQGVSTHSWEVVPGQVLAERLPPGPPSWTGLVFARYGSPGSHRLRLPQGGQLRLLLGESEAAILP